MRGSSAQSVRSAFFGLALVAVAVTTLAPHWDPAQDRSYWLPVHIDEYLHWGYAQAIADQGTVAFTDPFDGGPGQEFSVRDDLHERGFQAYMGAFQDLTGIPWVHLIAWTPLAVALLLALAVYAVTERWGAGPESVLWLAAIPTTLRFLGPGFFVPIAFSLPLVMLGLFVLLHERSRRGFLVLGVLMASLWSIHAMGALALMVLTALVALLDLRRFPLRALALVAVAALPFAAAWPYYSPFLQDGSSTPTLPASLEVVRAFGWRPLVLAAAGAAWLSARRETSAAGWSLGVALLAAQGVIVWRAHTDEDPLRLFDRTHMLAFVLVALLAGAATAAAWRGLRASLRGRAPSLGAAGVATVLLASGFAVGASAQHQFGQEYYVVMSPEQYDSFVAAAPTLAGATGPAFVDGPPTIPFSALTGLRTMYVQRPGAPEQPREMEIFFAQGSSDTYTLVAAGAMVVVTERDVDNPDLDEVAPGVFFLKPEIRERMARGRAG